MPQKESAHYNKMYKTRDETRPAAGAGAGAEQGDERDAASNLIT